MNAKILEFKRKQVGASREEVVLVLFIAFLVGCFAYGVFRLMGFV